MFLYWQQMYSCVASSPRDRPVGHFTKTYTQIRDLTKKDKNTAKECKILTLDIKIKFSVSGDMEETADLGNLNGTVGGSKTPCSGGNLLKTKLVT